jgi:hypothetical protein
MNDRMPIRVGKLLHIPDGVAVFVLWSAWIALVVIVQLIFR